MGVSYHFVNLDNAQTERRRQLLDSYGQFAQISALIIPLFSFQLFSAIRFLASKIRNSSYRFKGKEHQSPRVSNFSKPLVGSSTSAWSRLRWALDEQMFQGWGTRLEWLVGAIWTLWLLFLVIKDTGDDYLHLTKRFGIVASSQLPLHYLLAAKAWSPIQYLTRLSHEELNPYHRVLGRILIAFFSIHASMYLNFYIQSSLLSKRIRDRDVILGLLAITMFLTIGTTALSKIRNYSYHLFFTLHVLLSICLLPVLYFHVSHLRLYILESVVIYVLLILQRNISTTNTSAVLTHVPSTSLLSVSLRSDTLADRKYRPGQHIYLSLPATSTAPLNKLRLNPFTIANLPAKDHYLRLIIRPLAGTTQLLHNLVATSHKQPQVKLLFEGPYGGASYFPDLLKSYDRILLVAGGVGATFTLPIYRDLLQQARKGAPAESSVRFVWSVRKAEEVTWGIKYLQEADGISPLPPWFEVHVSGSRQQTTAEAGVADESIELLEHNHLLQDDEDPGSEASLEETASYRRQGRPDLKRVVNEVFTLDENGRVAVLVCGPASMGVALRREVGRWVGQGREVFWHSEGFGW